MEKIDRIQYSPKLLCVWLLGHAYFELRKHDDRVGVYIPALHEPYQEACGYFEPPFRWPETEEEAEAVAHNAVTDLFLGNDSTYGQCVLEPHWWGPEDRPPY